MQRKIFIALVALLIANVLSIIGLSNIADAQSPQPRAPRANLGTAFTYQGQLKNSGTPYTGACDFQFKLYDDASAGAQIGATQTASSVSVASGFFTTQIDFGAGAFNGNARWLDISVRCPAGSGSYTALTPRQAMTPAPMALALPGLYTQQNATSPNLIGGHSSNSITAGVVGATISGGGTSDYTNDVTDDYGTVGGGMNNQAGDNTGTTNSRAYATVGGGVSNNASGYGSTIGGGASNNANGYVSTINGGSGNNANGYGATIGGGVNNIASGNYAAIPGGINNVASVTPTFAAGRRAKAFHEGAFVWGDSTDADVASTATNQFVVRATNGLVLSQDAGGSKVVNTGEYYRDNSIIAWGRVSGTGTILYDYGISSVSHSIGVYTITLTAFTQTANSLIPNVTAVRDTPPTSASSARLITIRQYGFNQFIVYITTGSFALVDADFVFTVTGR